PFVELNCAALPETLFENELFGAAPGAHSTATRKIEGHVASAQGGTLFLDEVTELSPKSQAKLLQFLQDYKYRPLAQTRVQVADVRIIAATNVDPLTAIAAKSLREDLYYRLSVITIRV